MVVHATLVSEEGKDDLTYVVVPPTMPSILAGLPPKSEPRKSWEESEPSSSDIVGAMILASIALRETLHQDPQSLELSRPDWNASRNLPNSLGLWPPDVSQQPPDRVAHEPLGQRHGTLSLDRRGTGHGLGETHGDKFLVDGERKNRNPDRPWLISLQEAPIRSSISQSADKPVVSMPSDISTKSTAGRPNPVASENVGSLTSSRVTSSMSWLNESDPELPRRSSGQTFPSNPRPAREDLTQDSWERVLMGSMVSSCHYLCDLNGLKGAYFVFPDLSLRVEGIFRLRMSLYNLASIGARSDKPAVPISTALTQPFTSFTTREYPGLKGKWHKTALHFGVGPGSLVVRPCSTRGHVSTLSSFVDGARSPRKRDVETKAGEEPRDGYDPTAESSELSKHFSDQGLKIPIRRKEQRKSRNLDHG
ncbi:hypothetical protein PhCBS80983_g02275 [Powellomyces hirtus]|uniref:Velvet domain-containing protein n=1 Tax=Powellomyces hirtus TaxID=109895 RepID=A0A507E6L5_9FUNG|nr:hypothetical protein PhCBS80983_g02275 [Powellomyces hirtus]